MFHITTGSPQRVARMPLCCIRECPARTTPRMPTRRSDGDAESEPALIRVRLVAESRRGCRACRHSGLVKATVGAPCRREPGQDAELPVFRDSQRNCRSALQARTRSWQAFRDSQSNCRSARMREYIGHLFADNVRSYSTKRTPRPVSRSWG